MASSSSVEESLDLDERLEFWSVELEEEARRKDVMPPALPPSIENTRVIDASMKSMLFELIKKILAREPKFRSWSRYSGFFSDVRVDDPDSANPSGVREELCSSFHEFQTAQEAEEKATENMIRALESSCNFEVRDLNWQMKRQFHGDSYNSCTGWRAAEEKIVSNEMKMKSMKEGWRGTLESVEIWSEYIRANHVACPDDAVSFVLHEGINNFEEVCEDMLESRVSVLGKEEINSPLFISMKCI